MESVVTKEMVEAYAKQFDISLEDGSQEPGVVGSLEGLASGQGTLPDFMREDEVFSDVVKAYDSAKV